MVPRSYDHILDIREQLTVREVGNVQCSLEPLLFPVVWLERASMNSALILLMLMTSEHRIENLYTRHFTRKYGGEARQNLFLTLPP